MSGYDKQAGHARLADRVAVVTGAASGQGAAEAAALAAEGAVVYATDLRIPDERLEGVRYRVLDVSDPAGWAALASEITAAEGRVDILVNNAGMPGRSRVADVDLELWNRVFAVNVTGALLGMQTLLPLMPSGASIVNVASLAALTAHWPAAYTASKWALRGLSRVAANEFGPRGIRVNTIFPGYIQTPMVAGSGPEFIELSLAEIPLGRLGVVDDVAPLVVFLASDDSSFLTGTEIPVDGGQWSHAGSKRFSDAALRAPGAWGIPTAPRA